ncbi:MAG: P44/Msp2 family outer membrane protein [Gammaproteobacteria bacterium]|nr:P44/Msp2 family outer membrane protein [Gammaproteobacteria bacterium]
MKKLLVASSIVLAGLTATGTAFAANADYTTHTHSFDHSHGIAHSHTGYVDSTYTGGYTGGSSADQQGVYIEASGGANYLQNQLADSLEYDWGWNAGGAIGYKMGPWRAAFAFGYLDNNLDKLDSNTTLGNPDLNAKDDSEVWTFMGNGYYDIHMDGWPIVPYVGIGLGAINIKTRISNSTLSTTIPPFPTGSETETVFAYQGILGIAYPINNFRIFAEYRNLNSLSYELVDRSGSKIEDYYHNNLLNVGVSYLFSMA